MLDRLRSFWETFREYQRYSESPTDRVEEVGSSMICDPTLPNITLGAALTMSIQGLFGSAPRLLVAGSWGVFLVSVVVYAVGQEVLYVYKAAAESERGNCRDSWYQ